MNAIPPDRGVGAKQRMLLHVERLARVHWRLVFLLAVLAIAASAWLGSHLKLESDVLQLIPKGNPRIDTFREALQDFGSFDYLLVLLEAGDGKGPDELEDFADGLAEKLRARNDLVEQVEYRFQPDERFLQLFYENALLFLPPERPSRAPATHGLRDREAARERAGASPRPPRR
jgi:hypothetical protein